jgi:hypothetical protein
VCRQLLSLQQGEALEYHFNRMVAEARAALLQMMNTSSFAKTAVGRQDAGRRVVLE